MVLGAQCVPLSSGNGQSDGPGDLAQDSDGTFVASNGRQCVQNIQAIVRVMTHPHVVVVTTQSLDVFTHHSVSSTLSEGCEYYRM